MFATRSLLGEEAFGAWGWRIPFLLSIGLLGISYAVCALVPGLFIREKMFDPKAVESPLGAPAAALTVPAST